MASKSKHHLTPNVIGAGGGTSLLGLANLIPDTMPSMKSVAIYASPAAAVVITVVFSYLWVILKGWANRIQLDWTIKDARKIRDEVFSNPASSDDHKNTLQQNVEKLEQLRMEVITGQAENVKATLA